MSHAQPSPLPSSMPHWNCRVPVAEEIAPSCHFFHSLLNTQAPRCSPQLPSELSSCTHIHINTLTDTLISHSITCFSTDIKKTCYSFFFLHNFGLESQLLFFSCCSSYLIPSSPCKFVVGATVNLGFCFFSVGCGVLCTTFF